MKIFIGKDGAKTYTQTHDVRRKRDYANCKTNAVAQICKVEMQMDEKKSNEYKRKNLTVEQHFYVWSFKWYPFQIHPLLPLNTLWNM